MELSVKEEKLRKFAKSVLDNPKYKEEIDYLLEKMNFSKEEIIKEYINYDLDINAYNNEIYESLSIRFVLHLHNLLEGSWHQERQQIIIDFLKKINPENIIDMGFGVPMKYVKQIIFEDKSKKLTLVDMYKSAFDFSRILLNFMDKNYKENITFKKLDMNSHEYPGDYDCYIFQDSIEHVNNATEYLTKVVKFSKINSKFILSIPIGPKVPIHTSSWKKEEDAELWLNKCGLKITERKLAHINPEIDLFASELKEEFYNLVVICEKNLNIILPKIYSLIEDECKKETNPFGYSVWDEHILKVVENGKILAERYSADEEIVEISALFHDYAGIKNYSFYEEHHYYSAKFAEKILLSLNYPQEKVEKIKEVIISHRGNKPKEKKTVEAQCLADADVMAHFNSIISLLYLAFTHYKMNKLEAKEWLLNKIERDWKKLSPKTKEILREKYESIKKTFE